MSVPDENREAVLHDVCVRLVRNNMPEIKGEYHSITKNEATLNIDEVCATLKRRGGFRGDEWEVASHVRRFLKEAAYQLCDGFAVNMDYFSIYPVVGGTFDSPHEALDPVKHPVGFRIRPEPPLNAQVRRINIKVLGEADTRGSIESFTGLDPDSVKGTAVPGSPFMITGRRIKVCGDDPDIGVYFVRVREPEDAPLEEIGEIEEVKVNRFLAINTPSRVSSIIPPLPAGEWKIVIKTQYTRGGKYRKVKQEIESEFTVRSEQ